MRMRHSQLINAISLLFCSCAASLAQETEDGDFELIANGPVTYDTETNETVASDGASMRYGPYLLTADTIRFSNESGAAKAIGNVVFTRDDIRLIANTVHYDPQREFASIENFRAGNGRHYVEGELLEGNPDDFSFNGVNFLPGEPGTFLFKAKADQITILNRNEIKGKKLAFNLGNLPFFILPNITQPIDADTNIFDISADYSGHLGAAIGGEFRLPTSGNLRLGANILPTTKRGILFGPTAQYDWGDADSGTYGKGLLSTGYIDDRASLVGLDARGLPIDDERYFAEWHQVQRWNETVSVVANTALWSDTEVTRDFHEDSYNEMQDPDSYLEANYTTDDWQVSLFTRLSPNDFQVYTERLPELKFSLYPQRLKKGLYHNGYVSFAKLKGVNPTSSAEQDESDRADAYYGFDYYKSLSPGVTLKANLGVRSTHYFDATTFVGEVDPANRDLIPVEGDFNGQAFFATEGTRSFGDIGLDLKMLAYAELDFQSESWDIDGLRHVIEPIISYRYNPELGGSDSVLSYLDRPTLSNYLVPLELDERRDTDTLAEERKVRFELRNRIQTKGKSGDLRNLARFSFAMDYLLEDQGTGDDFSDFYTSVELTPAPWLDADFFTSYDIEDGSLTEFNSRVAVKDEGYWKIGVGNQFRKGLLRQYSFFGEYFLSEDWKLYGIIKYDRESGTFYEQRIGLLQRAVENYALKYEIVFYEGARRESNFGVRLGIDLFVD